MTEQPQGEYPALPADRSSYLDRLDPNRPSYVNGYEWGVGVVNQYKAPEPAEPRRRHLFALSCDHAPELAQLRQQNEALRAENRSLEAALAAEKRTTRAIDDDRQALRRILEGLELGPIAIPDLTDLDKAVVFRELIETHRASYAQLLADRVNDVFTDWDEAGA